MENLLIFDYDGTIHNTMGIYEPAFRKAHSFLIERGLAPDCDVSSERIASWLGMNSVDMWEDFLPGLDAEMSECASQVVAESMTKDISAGKAKWYPGAEEALTKLKEMGYKMVILSNCRISYRDAHSEFFETSRWFDRFYDCESYDFIPKSEIIKKVVEDYGNPDNVAMIGDRGSDMEAGRAVEAKCVGCRYGFGTPEELEGVDAIIDDVSELVEVFRK